MRSMTVKASGLSPSGSSSCSLDMGTDSPEEHEDTHINVDAHMSMRQSDPREVFKNARVHDVTWVTTPHDKGDRTPFTKRPSKSVLPVSRQVSITLLRISSSVGVLLRCLRTLMSASAGSTDSASREVSRGVTGEGEDRGATRGVTGEGESFRASASASTAAVGDPGTSTDSRLPFFFRGGAAGLGASSSLPAETSIVNNAGRGRNYSACNGGWGLGATAAGQQGTHRRQHRRPLSGSIERSSCPFVVGVLS